MKNGHDKFDKAIMSESVRMNTFTRETWLYGCVHLLKFKIKTKMERTKKKDV